MNDETAIRDLITRWVGAVHAGDLDSVLRDHDPDIVMFDVPPPHTGDATTAGSSPTNTIRSAAPTD